jgi:hypothetical protein
MAPRPEPRPRRSAVSQPWIAAGAVVRWPCPCPHVPLHCSQLTPTAPGRPRGATWGPTPSLAIIAGAVACSHGRMSSTMMPGCRQGAPLLAPPAHAPLAPAPGGARAAPCFEVQALRPPYAYLCMHPLATPPTGMMGPNATAMGQNMTAAAAAPNATMAGGAAPNVSEAGAAPVPLPGAAAGAEAASPAPGGARRCVAPGDASEGSPAPSPGTCARSLPAHLARLRTCLRTERVHPPQNTSCLRTAPSPHPRQAPSGG